MKDAITELGMVNVSTTPHELVLAVAGGRTYVFNAFEAFAVYCALLNVLDFANNEVEILRAEEGEA